MINSSPLIWKFLFFPISVIKCNSKMTITYGFPSNCSFTDNFIIIKINFELQKGHFNMVSIWLESKKMIEKISKLFLEQKQIPGQLFERMEQNQPSLYNYDLWLIHAGLDSILSESVSRWTSFLDIYFHSNQQCVFLRGFKFLHHF